MNSQNTKGLCRWCHLGYMWQLKNKYLHMKVLQFFLLFLLISCTGKSSINEKNAPDAVVEAQVPESTDFYSQLSRAAWSIIDGYIIYDPTYYKITYPNGDVPKGRGVCTDVIIRAYRVLGIDLQKLVHEDIKNNFSLYPSKRIWGLKAPDTNIDHRRVPNLQTFFSRHGEVLEIAKVPENYKPGDIVAWKLPNGLLHVGLVIDKKSNKGIPLAVHNIGGGQVAENVLFAWDIIGHYRYGGNVEN